MNAPSVASTQIGSVKPRILYAEDDANLGFVTADNLGLQGFEVIHCLDGQETLKRFAEEPFDLCILDVMMPKLDGFEVARRIRALNEQVPILLLTARTMNQDRLEGLRTGADDYLTKPFSMEELTLKVRIFLKRSSVSHTPSERKEVYTLGNYVFDYANFGLSIAGAEEHKRILTLREAQLLRLFCRKPNLVVPREEILSLLWGEDDYFMGRSLDVFISRLRKYLSHDAAVNLETVHKIGFIMRVKQ